MIIQILIFIGMEILQLHNYVIMSENLNSKTICSSGTLLKWRHNLHEHSTNFWLRMNIGLYDSMFQTKTNKEKNWWCEGSKVLQLASDVCDGVKAAKCLADALRALQVRGESEKGFESEIEKELRNQQRQGGINGTEKREGRLT